MRDARRPRIHRSRGSTVLIVSARTPTHKLFLGNEVRKSSPGLPKKDDRGRTLDVHALRTTFGTLLSKGGVPLRTAQEAMRHSDPKLTANVYTDPRLLDVAGSLDALPLLPLDSTSNASREAIRALPTGTYGRSAVAPLVAPTPVQACQTPSFSDQTITLVLESTASNRFDVTGIPDKHKGPPTSSVGDPFVYARVDLNHQPLASEASVDRSKTPYRQEVTSSRSGAYTPAYTGNEKEANDDPLAALLARLSKEDRERLVEMLKVEESKGQTKGK